MAVIFKVIFCCFLALREGARSEFLGGSNPLSDEMIDWINSLNTTWKAGRNFDSSKLEYVKRLVSQTRNWSQNGSRNQFRNGSLQLSAETLDNYEYPASFDARTWWPECSSIISLIRDQSNCGAGWAFAAVSAISDHICIDSRGSVKVNISAEDLISCGGLGGCDHSPDFYDAWVHWLYGGIVTGDLYGGGGCKPYSIEPGHHGEPPVPTPKCSQVCQAGYPKPYSKDKHYGNYCFQFDPLVGKIAVNIAITGPIQSAMTVHADFLSYKSGVYKVESEEIIGYHSVKIIGWGEENGVPYWLAANSWGTSWGDGGFFKIRRGFNESGIENEVVSGQTFEP